jgi:hypothetical protein
MSGAFFFIEYKDGSITEIEFKTPAMAKKAYKLYEREPEDNAKAYGWETKYEVPTLAQQIRAKKMTKELV